MPRYFRFSLLLPALLWSAPAIAGNAPIGGAGSCSGQTITDPVASTQGQQQAFDDGLYTCTGSVWAAEAFIVGGVDQSNSAPSCNSTNAGMVKYSSSTFYGCNGSSWVPMDSGMHLISSQTVSGATTLAFSGSNWSSSYNTLILSCPNLTESSDGGGEYFLVGEGGGPTWETGAHYINNQLVYENGAAGSFTYTTGATAIPGTPGLVASGGITSVILQIFDVGSSIVYKLVNYNYYSTKDYYSTPSGSLAAIQGQTYWNNDTNAITGIELVEGGGGGFSGTCTLYGM